jgi:glycosyltransferase involved in cell wall biosynthesis
VISSDQVLDSQKLAINKNRLVGGVFNRVLLAPNWFTYTYLQRACKVIKELSPAVILINSLPQYVRFVRLRFPHTPLGLFVRGEMGLSRRYLPLVDFIITNSRGISEYARGLLNGADVPVYQVPNSLEESYCPEPKSYAGEPVRKILYTGRIEPVKGVWELLLAFEQVRQKVPDAALTFAGGHYGKSPLTEFEQKLLVYAREKHLGVTVLGQVPNRELPEVYKQADLAVFPSICNESFGMVALEAMRCGLPVIASRRPGFEELVVPGETGLLVDDPKEPDSIAGCILELIEHPKLLAKMGTAGYEQSLQYVPGASYQQYISILEKNKRT